MKKFFILCLMAFMVCSCFCSTSTSDYSSPTSTTSSSSYGEYTGLYRTTNVIPCATSVSSLDQMCSYCSAQNVKGIASMAAIGTATLIPEFATLEMVDMGFTNSKVRIRWDGHEGEMNGCIVYVKTDHLKRLCDEIRM